MNLTRMGGLGVAAAASLATIAAGLAPAAAQVSAPRAKAAPVVTYYKGTPGLARLVPRHARAAETPATRHLFPRGARRLPSGHYSPNETVPSPSGRAAAAAAVTATRAPLVNFNGVSSLDSQVTNFEAKFEPPDQGLCKGNGFVLEAVNSAYSIYSSNGKLLRGPFNLNDLFNVGAKEFTSDPRCWFDRATQTWFASVLFLNNTSTVSTQLIAVRHNASPIGLWNEYAIDTTDLGGSGCPCFADQPRIGIDQTNLYITADEFSILGPQANGPEMWAISKADLVNGVASPHFVRFGNLTIAGGLGITPQPALATGNPNAEYFLSSLDFNGTGDNRIGVWAMTNRGAVGTGGMPTLSSVVISSEAYGNPPPASQKGSNSKLDSGDDRMQQVSFAGGTVWGALTTGIRPGGDSLVRAGIAWFQVQPTLGTTGITGASIVRQGYIAPSGRYEIYPSVQPDAAGNAAVCFTLTGHGRFPSAAYATLKAGASNFGPPVVAAAGFGSYDKLATRWGDYSFAVPDDSGHAAWFATEYVPPKSSQTTTGQVNWGTRVFEVPLG